MEVERCILHLNPRQMDLDSLVKLCRSHQLYDALIYIFNRGLMDYVTPLEDLLGTIDLSETPEAAAAAACSNSSSSNSTGTHHVKALLYLSYTLSGHAYPTGELEGATLVSARSSLIQYLSSTKILQTQSTAAAVKYPIVLHLLRKDTKETLDLLEVVFNEEETMTETAFTFSDQQLLFNSLMAILVTDPNAILRRCDILHVSLFLAERYTTGIVTLPSTLLTLLVQTIIDSRNDAIVSTNTIEDILVSLSQRIVLLHHQDSTKENNATNATNAINDDTNETNMSADLPTILRSLQKANLRKPAAVLFEQVGNVEAVVRSYLEDSSNDINYSSQVFDYIRKRAEEFIVRSFRRASSRASSPSSGYSPHAGRHHSQQQRDTSQGDSTQGDSKENEIQNIQLEQLRETVLSLLPELTKLDRNRAAQVVLVLFPDQHETVIQKLQDPWLQFNYLQQLMRAKHQSSGVSSSSIPSGGRIGGSTGMTDLLERSGATVTPDMHKLYVKLLCQFEKESVITYLKSNDQYPIDDCLRLCQKYDVSEARAYLLERTGDIHGAMTNLLATMETRLSVLKSVLNDADRLDEALASPTNNTRAFRARSSSLSESNINQYIASKGSGKGSGKGSARNREATESPIKKVQRVQHHLRTNSNGSGTSRSGKSQVPSVIRNLNEFVMCEAILNDLVGLCERNSHFNIDRSGNGSIKMANGFTSSSKGTATKQENNNEKLWFTLLDFIVEHKHQASGGGIQHSHDDLGASLSTVLADFVHVILTHMNGHVPLHSVLAKITNDHKNQEFREFRSTITGMLENVRYEQKILQTAKQLLADAKFRQVEALHRGTSLSISSNQVKVKEIYIDRTRSSSASGTSGENKNEMMNEEEIKKARILKERLRRVQRARRRDHKAHPPREDKEDDGDSDYETEELEGGIKYGHHVLQLR